MFTGIIEEIGKIKSITKTSDHTILSILCKKVLEDIKIGDSIAVNGICLTATTIGVDSFSADVMPETINRTNFNNLKLNDSVNLERALKLSDRLGGHIVTGHIDGTGVIVEKADEKNATIFTIESHDKVLKYIVEKGSVALDGTSLTVVSSDKKYFKVSLIPLTKGHTNLGMKKKRDLVNIECDIIGKYVERLVESKENSEQILSKDFLRNNGFL